MSAAACTHICSPPLSVGSPASGDEALGSGLFRVSS